MRTLSLIFSTVIAVSSQAHAWGEHHHNDNRTYRGPSAPPVVVHPINQTYPVYRPSPIYRPGPVYRSGPIFRPAPIYRPSPVLRISTPNYWRSGYWSNTWHDNRFGWWWVTGNGWSFYSSPSYPYPEYREPQTTVIYESNPQPPPPQVTVVQSAPTITQTAPAEPRPSGNTSPPSNTGMYYFCEPSQLYYPYAKNCSERWTAVSSMPN